MTLTVRKLDKDDSMRMALDYLQRARMLMANAAELDMDDPDPIGICMDIDNVGENLEKMIRG